MSHVAMTSAEMVDTQILQSASVHDKNIYIFKKQQEAKKKTQMEKQKAGSYVQQ